jgi:hypothetical protein
VQSRSLFSAIHWNQWSSMGTLACFGGGGAGRDKGVSMLVQVVR